MGCSLRLIDPSLCSVIQDSPPGQEGWIQTVRSECLETGWWISKSQGPCHPEQSEGSPPPRRAKFASLICLGSPPVQEGSLWWVVC